MSTVAQRNGEIFSLIIRMQTTIVQFIPNQKVELNNTPSFCCWRSLRKVEMKKKNRDEKTHSFSCRLQRSGMETSSA